MSIARLCAISKPYYSFIFKMLDPVCIVFSYREHKRVGVSVFLSEGFIPPRVVFSLSIRAVTSSFFAFQNLLTCSSFIVP